MEAVSAVSIPLLDHGYIKLIETWGSDQRIVEAARMSTDKGFQGWGHRGCPECLRGMPGIMSDPMFHCKKCNGTGYVPGDEKLLAYLWEHKHATPFEMAGLIIEVQAPIVVFREWHRHRTQSYNEMSGRYTKLPDLYYVPSIERLMASKQAAQNKQSSSDGISQGYAIEFQKQISDTYKVAREQYEYMLSLGVSREVARLVLPVAQYSRMRASANLRNWLAFLTLRMDPAAQWEIRQYANALGEFIAQSYPRTWELFQLSH